MATDACRQPKKWKFTPTSSRPLSFTEHSELVSRLASHDLLKKITHLDVQKHIPLVKEHQKMLRLPSSRFRRARKACSCRKQRLNQVIHSENQDGADRRKKQAHVAADEHELSFQNAKRIYRNKMRLSWITSWKNILKIFCSTTRDVTRTQKEEKLMWMAHVQSELALRSTLHQWRRKCDHFRVGLASLEFSTFCLTE